MPTSILFQYRIFPIRSFRRTLTAYAVFVILFETASTIVFIVPCNPISHFWTDILGYVTPSSGIKDPSRCTDLVRFLLINGCINTVTDFGLLILVSNVYPLTCHAILIRAIASTITLASPSEHFAEIYSNWHLHHWSNVSLRLDPFTRTTRTEIALVVLLP